MRIKTAAKSAYSIVAAVAIGGALFSGDVVAGGHDVKVDIHVSAKGLDLKQPSGARTLYERIQHAADIACTHGNRIDLTPLYDPKECREQALGEAIRSVDTALLTQLYLETHTLRQAAAHGIKVPQQVAANH